MSAFSGLKPRAALAVLGFLAASSAIALAGVPSSPFPAPTPSPSPQATQTAVATVDDVISALLDANPGLESYRAHMTLDVRETNFPWFHLVLTGTQRYHRPGFYVVDAKDGSSLLKGVTKVQGSGLAANRWKTCYVITLRVLPDTYRLHMVPKINGPVAAVDLTVDRGDATITRIVWYYKDDGDSISFDQRYSLLQGYRVVTQQSLQVKRGYVRAVGAAEFDGFEFNVPVPTPTPTPSNPLHRCDD